jgi:autotransporter-associated beta strand protein
MKLLKNKSSLLRLGPALLLVYNLAPGAVQYWDPQGTTGGNPYTGDMSGTWENNSWSTASGGLATPGAWVEGNAACFGVHTGIGTPPFTITMNADHNIAGGFDGPLTPNSCDVTIAGTGHWKLANGQGFNLLNASDGSLALVRINVPIIDGSYASATTGQLVAEGTGQLFLNAANTYSGGSFGIGNGGTLLGYSGANWTGIINFNNSLSFGVGSITLMRGYSGGAGALVAEAPGITITNTLDFSQSLSNAPFLNIVGGSAGGGGTTFSGPVLLGTKAMNLGSGVSGNLVTLSGIVSGSGSLAKYNPGTLVLSGANTYSGKTTVSAGVLSVSSFNKVTSGSPSSNLGAPTTAASGTIGIGSGGTAATLIYAGSGETSDRVIDLAGTTGGATLEADGSGALVLTANNTATGSGAKTFTLQGSSTTANSIGKIVGATSVAKAQAGSWTLTGANTYTGGTTVGAGTLEISGSVAGSVTNSAGVLTLDNSSALASGATLAVSSGSTVNLNFTGTNAINALMIDGASQVSGVWGPPGSSAPNQNAIFAGTGYVIVLGKPVIVQQPVSGIVWQGDITTFAFTVGVAGDLGTLTYQWKQNGANIPGATSSSYAIPSPAALNSAGSYVCAVTNAFGNATSASATLTVRATNAYTQTIRGDGPVSYWRLNETNGTVAFDAVGTNNGVYVNANLNQPGFSSVSGSDPAIGIPANPANKGIMVVSNASPAFKFGGFPFTLEAWGMSTNFGAGIKQRLISTLSISGTGGYAFGFPNSTTLEFTAGGVAAPYGDNDVTLTTPLAQGVWYHFVVVYDGNNLLFYLNGAQVGSLPMPVTIPDPANQLALGNNPLTFPGEQLYGGIDEVAIYNQELSGSQIFNHYQARYADLAAPTTTTPVVTPPTNYVSLSATIIESAGGQGLTYQWYKGNGTGNPIGGATASTLALSNLQLSDSGSYHCIVTDVANHTADSGPASLTVVLIPTDASQLNLVNGLVVHLPFDSDYKDISGRANDGTAVGAPALLGSAAIGSSALHYGTTNGLGTNYVTLGIRPDLQFGATNDFTVAYWVRGNNTTLPYFCDSTNGLNGIFGQNGGFYFGPSTNGAGSWEAGLASAAHQATLVGSTYINDGNWHHLVHSVKRSGSMETYLDGSPVSSTAVSYITDSIDTLNPANIGQDGTGQLVLADAEGDLDDLGVWRRTLTDFEVAGIYLAGATNHVSFAPIVVVAVALQVQQVSPGQYQIVWPGTGWTLQASPSVTGGYTNVPAATSPYPVPTSSGPQLFYRLKQ